MTTFRIERTFLGYIAITFLGIGIRGETRRVIITVDEARQLIRDLTYWTT